MRPRPARSENPGARPRLTVLGGGGGAIAAQRDDRDARFRDIYDRWFTDVVRWLYALGMPSSDTEDLAQEIFLVVRRKLDRFDGGNLAGWLYRIAQLTVRDHRRRAWFKNLVLRRRNIDLARVEMTTRLMPKVLLIMPTLVTATLASGWQLGRYLGTINSDYANHGWIVASYIVVGVMAVIALGLLEPANVAVLFELKKPRPNPAVIQRLMKRFIYTAGVIGAMQVATLVIMTKVATG